MTMVLDGSGVSTTGVPNLGTAQASTSGTAITFTGIPSGVKRITAMFNGVSTNGSSLVQVQIGSGSYTSSGYNSGAYTNTTKTVATSGFLIDASGNALYLRSGLITICAMSSNIWVVAGSWSDQANSNISYFSGGVTISGTLDRLQVTTVNGTDTFDAGSINILYE